MTPDEFTIQELMLPVSGGHELYVQDWGNQDAVTPIIFLHGGPGSCCKDKHKNSFNPQSQRVIFFDQRGAGRSTPYGMLKNNTTDDLVKDIIQIADKLEVDKFVLTGGSWGSCLALTFAIRHPKRVAALVLNGIFLGTKEEISWLDQGRFQTFYPDVWNKYLDDTPAEHRQDPSKYHFERVANGREQARLDSAYAYAKLEGGVIKLDDRFMPGPKDEFDPMGMSIEMNYLHNDCFLPDRYIIDNAPKLTMPVWLVQGRYDMVCPPVTAYQLDQKLPNSKLIWTVSGHLQEREGWAVIKTILEQFR